jgi:hypothetical protein
MLFQKKKAAACMKHQASGRFQAFIAGAAQMTVAWVIKWCGIICVTDISVDSQTKQPCHTIDWPQSLQPSYAILLPVISTWPEPISVTLMMDVECSSKMMEQTYDRVGWVAQSV